MVRIASIDELDGLDAQDEPWALGGEVQMIYGLDQLTGWGPGLGALEDELFRNGVADRVEVEEIDDEDDQEPAGKNEGKREELVDLLESRRDAIEKALKERRAAEEKVDALDRRIVDELLPKYRAAADKDKPAILSEMRRLNAERSKAAEEAVRWAKFHGVAMVMAQNARAQAALIPFHEAARAAGDEETAAEVNEAFLQVGQATQQLKQTRERQKRSWTVQNLDGQMARHAAAVKRLEERLAKLLAGRDPKALEGEEKGRLERLQKGLEAARRLYDSTDERFGKAVADARAVVPTKVPVPAQLPPPPEGASKAPLVPTTLKDFEPDSYPLGDAWPFCETAGRGPWGPMCKERGEIEFNGLDGFWSKIGRAVAGVATLGASELALNKKARGGIAKAVRKIGQVAKGVAKAVACPMVNKVGDKAAMAGMAYGPAGAAAAGAAAGALQSMCKGGQPGMPPDMPSDRVEIVEDEPLWKAWWFWPALIGVAGIGGAIYLSRDPQAAQVVRRVQTASPAPAQSIPRTYEGLGGRKRRKSRKHGRRRARPQLCCGCGG